MRRAVLAQADRIMGVDKNRWQLAQRRQPQRRAHIVAENQKCRAEGAQPTVVDQAIGDRAHGVLADAIEDVATGITPFLANGTLAIGRQIGGAFEVAGGFQRGVG